VLPLDQIADVGFSPSNYLTCKLINREIIFEVFQDCVTLVLLVELTIVLLLGDYGEALGVGVHVVGAPAVVFIFWVDHEFLRVVANTEAYIYEPLLLFVHCAID